MLMKAGNLLDICVWLDNLPGLAIEAIRQVKIVLYWSRSRL
jgi:hypothetical protein